jgi:predicted DNA-binding protein
MQEEVNEKTIALCIKGGKITADILKVALRKYLQEMEKNKAQSQQKAMVKKQQKTEPPN